MRKMIRKAAKIAAISIQSVRAILGLVLVTALVSTGQWGAAQSVASDIIPEAAGDLDPTFGTGGKIATDFSVDAVANAVALQPDGKIVVAGFAATATVRDFGIARYNPDGGLDPSFGRAGSVGTDFSGGDDRAFAVAIQPDGKIVVAGTATSSTTGFDFALARYNTNGDLDTSFGTAGKVTTDFFGRDDRAFSLLIQANGKLVASGFATTSSGITNSAIVRYNTDGSVDAKATINLPQANVANAAAFQTDGKFLLVGSFNPLPNDSDFGLVRLDNNGPDKSFGNQGLVATDFGGNDIAASVALQPDGKIVAVGTGGGGPGAPDFALARYNSDGSLDNGFGSGGKVTTDFFGGLDVANAVVIQPDGKIVAIGFASTGSTGTDIALARYNADGSLDSTFGPGGKRTADFFGSDDQARAAVIQPDGTKIVIAGGAAHSSGGPRQVILARYLTGFAPPQPDFSLGFDQPTVTADRSSKVKVRVNITRTGGFTGNVTVTPPDPAMGIKAKPPDPIATTGSSVAFKIKVGGNVPAGSYQLIFTGRDDAGRIHTATATVVVP